MKTESLKQWAGGHDMQDKLSDAKGNRAIATSMARGAAKAARAAKAAAPAGGGGGDDMPRDDQGRFASK